MYGAHEMDLSVVVIGIFSYDCIFISKSRWKKHWVRFVISMLDLQHKTIRVGLLFNKLKKQKKNILNK